MVLELPMARQWQGLEDHSTQVGWQGPCEEPEAMAEEAQSMASRDEHANVQAWAHAGLFL